MGFDPKSLELAEHFLTDEPTLDLPENRQALAQTIQDAVEAWFRDVEQMAEPAEGDHDA